MRNGRVGGRRCCSVMSRYLGKLLLESGAVDSAWLESGGGLCVKYAKVKDMFLFRIGGGEGQVIGIGSPLCMNMAAIRGMLDFQYKWSVGYKVREKRGVDELRSLRAEELELLGGRRELILSGQLDNDEDFDILCAIQYLYNLSETFLLSVKRSWRKGTGSKWVQIQKRVLGHAGRKKGGKNSVKSSDDSESETLEELLARCEWNRKVAVKRGFYEWYLEACKEEAKALGKKLDKDEVLSQWNELRAKMEM